MRPGVTMACLTAKEYPPLARQMGVQSIEAVFVEDQIGLWSQAGDEYGLLHSQAYSPIWLDK